MSMNDRLIGRAAFLGVLGAGVAGLFVGRDVAGFAGRLVPDSLPDIAPSSTGWRIYTVADHMPDIAAVELRVRVGGLVERPTTFTLADLKAFPRAEQVSDFHCVTGWSVYDVRWAGVRLRHLLDAAGARPTASYLRFVSDEVPYDDSLELRQAQLPDVMLAYEMDGKPLERAHGGPLRLVVPQMYGYKSVKWVTGIELMESYQPGYWEQRGYDNDAWVGDSNGLSA